MATPFDTTDEDQFTMGRPSIARLDLRERISKQQENPTLTASDLEEEELREEQINKPIEMSDPLVKFIRGRTEAAKIKGQPTELQKKYEEMGLEYDYQKREETGSEWSDPEKQKAYMQSVEKQLEEVNPDFVQRNRDAFVNTDLRDQLRQKTQEEMGRLDAAELRIWSDPALAETSYGKTAMRMIRSRQGMIQSLTEAEDAKLDGRFYDELPEKDKPVANMLFSSGVTGRSMTTLTVNNGNIRDIIAEAVLQVPEDKREEFKQRLLGDYERDDQGNIMRNALGEELRKGGDFVSLTPYGTYDYKISSKAYERGVNGLLSQYQGGNDIIKEVESIEKRIETAERIQSKLNPKSPDYTKKMQQLDGEIDFLSSQAANILLSSGQTPTTGEAPTGEAPTGEAPTTEITAEESQLEEVKKSYLKSPKITELANGLLSYEDDLPEDKKQMIDEFNKKIEEEKIRKSGRGSRVGAFLEGTGIPSAGREINRTIYKYSGAELGAELGAKAIGRAYEGVADFLSGIEESGRKKILEEEATKSRTAQGKGLFD